MLLNYKDEKLWVPSQCDNRLIIIGNETDEIIKELFISLLNRYQVGLEKSMKDSSYVVYYVTAPYHKCHRFQLRWIIHRISLMNKWYKSYNKTIKKWWKMFLVYGNTCNKPWKYWIKSTMNNKN